MSNASTLPTSPFWSPMQEAEDFRRWLAEVPAARRHLVEGWVASRSPKGRRSAWLQVHESGYTQEEMPARAAEELVRAALMARAASPLVCCDCHAAPPTRRTTDGTLLCDGCTSALDELA